MTVLSIMNTPSMSVILYFLFTLTEQTLFHFHFVKPIYLIRILWISQQILKTCFIPSGVFIRGLLWLSKLEQARETVTLIVFASMCRRKRRSNWEENHVITSFHMILDRNPLRDVLESALGQQDSQSLPLNQLRLEC